MTALRNSWMPRAALAALLGALVLPLIAQDEPPAGLNGGRLERPGNKQPARPTPHWPDGHVNLGPLPGEKGVWEGNAGSTLATNVRGIDNPRMNLPTNLKVSEVPFQPWASALYAYRQGTTTKDDPHTKCLPSGGPRLFHTPYGFEFVEVPDEKRIYMIEVGGPHTWRTIYMDGRQHPKDLDPSFFGHSVGHWDGDALVVDTVGFNERFWLTREGIPHTEYLHLSERFTRTDYNTLKYEATIDDSKVFTKPWTINIALHRRTDRDRLFEYSCESELEEVNGAFTREARTWYPGSPTAPPIKMPDVSRVLPAPAQPVANLRRTPDGKPDLQGFYESKSSGANQSLEGKTGGRNLIIDPPDGKLPSQPWAKEEKISRDLSERGYDDPTAHCFPQGAPRTMWVPQGIEMIQTPDYIVFLFERVQWRIVPLDGRPHLPESMRLWEGDSVGHWEGDTLVIDTTNMNGKTWLGEGGEVISYAAHVVERFTPVGADTLNYEATVTDPVVYTRPWTIAFPVKREKFELIEAACHEEDHDLPHLKAIKDAAAAKKK